MRGGGRLIRIDRENIYNALHANWYAVYCAVIAYISDCIVVGLIDASLAVLLVF